MRRSPVRVRPGADYKTPWEIKGFSCFYAAKSGVLFCIYIVYSNVFRFLGNHCCKFFYFLRNHFPFLWEPIWQNKNCLFINRQLYFPLLLWYNDKYPDYIIKKRKESHIYVFSLLVTKLGKNPVYHILNLYTDNSFNNAVHCIAHKIGSYITKTLIYIKQFIKHYINYYQQQKQMI